MTTGSWNNRQTVSKIPKRHRDRTWTVPEKKIIDKGETNCLHNKIHKSRIFILFKTAKLHAICHFYNVLLVNEWILKLCVDSLQT